MKKSIVIISFLLLFLTVTTTLAAFSSNFNVDNNFKVASYDVTLEENFPSTIWNETTPLTKSIKIKNNGTDNLLLRVKYVETWYKENDGEKIIYNNLIDGNEVVQKNWNSEFTTNFINHNGWYYYTKLLPASDEVSILESIQKVQDVYNDSTFKYELDFYYEVVQDSSKAAQSLWDCEATITDNNVSWNFN